VRYWLIILVIGFISLTNLAAVVAFVIEDYYENSETKVLDSIEILVTTVFSLELAYNLWKHPRSKVGFFFKWDTWIDILTIVPPLLQFIFKDMFITFGFLRILRMFKVMRIFRILKLIKQIDKRDNDSEEGFTIKSGIQGFSLVQTQIIKLLVSIVVTMFIAAGIVTFIDNQLEGSFSQTMTFLDAFYYMIVTASSIGYGDIYPTNTVSRMSIMVIIMMILSVFGNQISKLAEIIRESDFYDTTYNFKDHVIILGTLKTSILSRFLLHFYKSQLPGKNPPKCIIIGEKRITNKIKHMLSFSLFEDQVFYLSTKAIDKNALRKGAFKQAAAIFYLTN